VATIGLRQHQVIESHRSLSQQLQGAFTRRLDVEQAKGMLAERLGVDPPEAFNRLRSHARAPNRRLADLARDVLTGRASLPADEPPPAAGRRRQIRPPCQAKRPGRSPRRAGAAQSATQAGKPPTPPVNDLPNTVTPIGTADPPTIRPDLRENSRPTDETAGPLAGPVDNDQTCPQRRPHEGDGQGPPGEPVASCKVITG
jgi:hypothetical protein